MQGKSAQARARDFLRVAHRFKLGHLTTEQPHPATRELSRWARHDLAKAISVLKSVDLRALEELEHHARDIDRLTLSVLATLDSGKRVFLVGCGATGRLSLSLEFLWRQSHEGSDRVRSFMAGGDVALVHALEGFEDHPAHGARHLQEMGFADGDLLIACTEGGETPYVIGAVERAAEISTNPPHFLYCNADAVLAPRVERFRRVRDNPRIVRTCLNVGPMALAGSTRMQASTVLQLAVGAALLHPEEPSAKLISEFRRRVRDTDYSFLRGLVELESGAYASGNHVVYRVRDFGITVLTDTTERAPTFSLAPFEQLNGRPVAPSLCYVSLCEADSPADAWDRLLLRPPRPLNWPEVDPRSTAEYLYGFDFSAHALGTLRRRTPDRTHHEFRIHRSPGGIGFELGALAHDVAADGMSGLLAHLLLKQMLNIHSTLVMGRLGRYESNLMTWVSPTNGKLVDRAARYVQHLLACAGREAPSYETVVHRLFDEMDRVGPDDPVVLRTFRSLSRDPERG
jgi:N-acetylmuramic acid 6-phosphate etherase